MAGALIFLIAGWRPWRTSWLIVGTKTLLLFSRSDVDGGESSTGAGHSGSHAWGDERWDRVLGLEDGPRRRAKGGPLPRPRARSVAVARRACQTLGGPLDGLENGPGLAFFARLRPALA